MARPELVKLTYKPWRGQIMVWVEGRLLGRVITTAEGKALIEPYSKVVEFIA